MLTAQISNPDVNREVIVMFQPNVVQLPLGMSEVSVDQLQSVPDDLRGLLQKHQVDKVRKAFPGFNPADTLKVTREGLTVGSMNLSRVFVLRSAANQQRDSLIAQLRRLSQVIYAEPNAMGQARVIPNDQYFSLQWPLKNTGQSGGTAGADIKANLAWDIFNGSSNTILAIVDVGRVQNTHPDFAGRVSGNLAAPVHFHSTHVAGIAAAKGNNSIGIAGVDWNAQINTQRMGDIPAQATAIRAAVDAGARIINNSWGQGSYTFSVLAKSAFVYAHKANVISCNAMPEFGSDEDYPNAYGQGIVNVGATTQEDNWAWYSNPNQAPYIDVSAPGGSWDDNCVHDVLSTINTPRTSCALSDAQGGNYDKQPGTSAAAPHVAGIASLLKGYAQDVQGRTLYNDDIEHIIQLSADKVPLMYGHDWTPEFGCEASMRSERCAG